VEDTRQSNEDQAKAWNGPSGAAWIDAQQVLDQMFRPIEALMAEAVFSAGASRALDIGCGTGSTTLAIARRLGTNGRAIGVDISEPMIAVARAAAERARVPASFIAADAQTYTFQPASIDMFVSRFGVMFFDDPVRAFANLRKAAAPNAVLQSVVWRAAADNPFMTTAERAAAPMLPDLPPRQPNAPGQFAFADTRRVQSILDESGWTKIDIQPLDVECTLPESELNRYVTRLGPVGMALREADERTRQKIADTVRAAFAPYVHGADVRFTAACWLVMARNVSDRD
jgi:ubiquinone/menaquinone biosynthesis C-methylase UbiE